MSCQPRTTYRQLGERWMRQLDGKTHFHPSLGVQKYHEAAFFFHLLLFRAWLQSKGLSRAYSSFLLHVLIFRGRNWRNAIFFRRITDVSRNFLTWKKLCCCVLIGLSYEIGPVSSSQNRIHKMNISLSLLVCYSSLVRSMYWYMYISCTTQGHLSCTGWI
jgi:hypothetical protein